MKMSSAIVLLFRTPSNTTIRILKTIHFNGAQLCNCAVIIFQGQRSIDRLDKAEPNTYQCYVHVAPTLPAGNLGHHRDR